MKVNKPFSLVRDLVAKMFRDEIEIEYQSGIIENFGETTLSAHNNSFTTLRNIVLLWRTVDRYETRAEEGGKRSGKRGNIEKIAQGKREKERRGERKRRAGGREISLIT